MASHLRGALPWWLAAVALVLLAAALPGSASPARACAFLRIPHTYEAELERSTYLAAIDAASIDALQPGDPYFGLPAVELGTRAARVSGARRIPQTLLKAIAWEESALTMASRSTRFETVGPALVSFDCGHGVMQVTSGMTVPLGVDGLPTAGQVRVATHYGYNIARGAAVLADKWNEAPDRRPIAGTDTASDPSLIENWYYAVWAYNGFVGPASTSSNHPLDPTFGAWPRARYRCDGTQSRNRYPYQELVWGCMASPPSREGAMLWAPIAVSLPDVTQPRFFEPLSLASFVFPYASMDMPTPQPAHRDSTPTVPAGFRARLFGAPDLTISEQTVVIRLNGAPNEARVTIDVRNPGSGILSWLAIADDDWIVVDPPAGVALGAGAPCGTGCAGKLEITVNPTLLSASSSTGTLRIVSATTGAVRVLRVEVDVDFEVAAPGTSRAN